MLSLQHQEAFNAARKTGAPTAALSADTAALDVLHVFNPLNFDGYG
jgi:hypothetical protein